MTSRGLLSTAGRTCVGTLIVLSLALSGCGLAVSNEERLANAEAAFSRGDFRVAIIDTRSILLDEPENVAARVLLGRAAVEAGDAVTAEKELRRAISLGHPAEAVAVDLARAMLQQRRYEDLVTEFAGLEQTVADPVLASLVADAHLGAGRPERAREIYTEVLGADESNRRAQLGIVESYVAEDNFLQARATLTEILQSQVDFPEALIVSAALHQRNGRLAAAKLDLERARNLAAGEGAADSLLSALTGLVEISLAAGDLDEARSYTNELEQLAPGSVVSLRLAARIAYLSDNLDVAQQKLQEVLRRLPNDSQAHLLMGAIHLKNGNLGQAEMLLSAVVGQQPDNVTARRLLAEARLRLERAGEAADLLKPAADDPGADSQTLVMAARVSAQAGDFDSATEYLERSTAANPGNVDLQLNLAFAHVLAGDVDRARQVIDAIADDEAGSAAFRRDLIAVLADLRGDPAGAHAAAAALRDEWPDRAPAHLLHGLLLLGASQFDAARDAFQDARLADPGNLHALRYLARTDEAEGKPDAASRRYREILEANATDEDALISLARIATRDGRESDAKDWLERARAADPRAERPRLFLARLYLAERRFDKVDVLADEVLAIHAGSAAAHDLQGLARLGSGEAEDAVDSFSRAVELDPQNETYRVHVAEALARSGETSAAVESLEAERDATLDHLQSGLMLVRLHALSGELEKANDVAQRLRERHPGSALPLVLQAELAAKAGDANRAAVLYDAALDIDSDRRYAVRAYVVRRDGQVPDPAKPLLDYLDGRPDDPGVLLVLAGYHDSRGQGDRALEIYERIVETDDDNFVAVNNLAWMYFTRGDARAEELARRAYDLAPENGSVVDTLGWILFNRGDVDEGVELLRKAAELNPSPQVRYHLAAGLAAQGAIREARSILETVLAEHAEFAARDEARTLLASL